LYNLNSLSYARQVPPTFDLRGGDKSLRALTVKVARMRITQFTAINLAVSPLGLAIFLCFSKGLAWPPVLAFVPANIATALVTYKSHRARIFTGDHFYWRRHLIRWIDLRIAGFVLGLAVMGALTSMDVPGIVAIIVNGVLQWRPSFWATEHWVFPAEVQEAKA
jgi:putative flippase GtrA